MKTIVLTIAPAKRLATSLGIENLNDKPKKITQAPLDKADGEMWAMMLDTKRTFDRLVEKYSATQETKDRIFKNKLYQHMSSMLAGTQEYMAMERLYEIHQENLYDVIIVDTPPMQNALDFLNSPEKMMNMINNSMLHLLLKPTMSLGKTSLNFIKKGSQQILKLFDRITGFAFMQDLSEMLIAFEGLLSGFESRASQVHSLLENKCSQFVLVCTTHENSVDEAKDFQQKVLKDHYTLSNIIANRVYLGTTSVSQKQKDELKQFFSADDVTYLVKNYSHFIPLIKRDKRQLSKLENIIGKGNLLQIPLFYSDVHHLNRLQYIATHL